MTAKVFRRSCLLGGFLLLIVFGKLWFIASAAKALPTWDQWDSECEITLRPWLEHRLGWQNIFLPHVEHRIVTTKLTALGLLIANGQWDGLVETTFNAAIHMLSALTLLLLGRRWLQGGWLVAFGGLLLLLFTLPFSWENTLVGFQVQFYYLLLFSVLHIWLTLETDRLSWRWVGGIVAGFLALLSMASGFIAAAAVLFVLGWRLVRARRWTAQQVTTAALALAICALGWWLKTDVPGHAFLKAQSVGKFVVNVLTLLSWPASAAFPWALLIVTPVGWFAWRSLRERALTSSDAILLGLFAWAGLQICAVSYSRGGGDSVLTSRYLDLVSVMIVLGWISIAREFKGRARMILATVWLLVIVGGLAQQSLHQWRTGVSPNLAHREQQEENVRSYLQTGDPAHLRDKPFADIPYPDAESLIQRLSHASIRNVLPWTVRRAIPLAGANNDARLIPAGLASPPAPLAFSTWSPAKPDNTVVWRSALQSASTMAVLRFRIVGELGDPRKKLGLVVKSRTADVVVQPDSVPGPRWKTVSIVRPAGEWWIEASDQDATGWFAFTEPVELSRGSYFVGKLIKHHALFGVAALLLLIPGSWPSLRRCLVAAARWRPRPVRLDLPVAKIAAAALLITFAAALVWVAAARCGFVHPTRPPLAPDDGSSGPAWLLHVPRNYSWFAAATLAIWTLLFLPGIALRHWFPARWPAGLAYLPIPGLLALTALGWLGWVAPTIGAFGEAAWLVAHGIMLVALGCAWRPLSLPSVDKATLGTYLAVCVGTLAFGVLPQPVVQEFDARSTAQARMVASPPDHAIAFRTAVYFHQGLDGRAESDGYFGRDWSVGSRGPLVPFAINALFGIFGTDPRPGGVASLEAWPAANDGYYLARILLVSVNGFVLLAGVALARALAGDASPRPGCALLWLAAAPVVMINLDFTWPKLLATAFFLLALLSVFERRALWLTGCWAAIAYLAHPLGALLTPMLALFLMHRAWHEAGAGGRIRAAFFPALKLTAGWLLVASPWLAFKMSLGAPEAFTHYPLGDGRGLLAARSVSSWLDCRLSNLWLSLTPFAFFKSGNMYTWLHGALSEPTRWAISYAKTLPAGLGHGIFLAAIWALIRPAPGLPVGLRRWLLAGTLATMLVFWGFSGDGLGRNCLEPLSVLVIIYTAVAIRCPAWWAVGLAGLALAEAFSVRWIGIIEGGAAFPLDWETLALTTLCISASVAALTIATRAIARSPAATVAP